MMVNKQITLSTTLILYLILLTLILCCNGDYVPVYVMMPLNLVSSSGELEDTDKLQQQLTMLKKAGADGVMVDVWWGIVQRSKDPFKYDWSAYADFFQLCSKIGLQVQANLAFHQCGTNVGDECYITLPSWVLAVGNKNPDIFYTDQHGNRDKEYLSLGVDDQPIFPGGKTGVQLYSDFMISFYNTFKDSIGKKKLIHSIEIGLGPAGEMRYPSYQLQNNLWSFPGVGEFQCYDKYMLASLNRSSFAHKRPEWGKAGPDNSGNYRDYPPGRIPFFADFGFDNYNSDYGHFFLSWYSDQLIQHGDKILSAARKIFVSNSDRPIIAAKIAGIHWWYNTFAHPAELTAGYYNTFDHDGYTDIANMFKENNVEFAFTCLEMLDQNQHDCGCGPQELVDLTRDAAKNAGIRYSGENALPIFYDQQGYNQILSQAKKNGKTLDSFTYLRMADQLFTQQGITLFSNFVSKMHDI